MLKINLEINLSTEELASLPPATIKAVLQGIQALSIIPSVANEYRRIAKEYEEAAKDLKDLANQKRDETVTSKDDVS